MSPGFSRRQFLRGDFRKPSVSVRPPGAMNEAGFLEACSRCSACIEVCPEKIIKKDKRGYPVLDFSQGGCTFCQKCSEACEPGALQGFGKNITPWNTIADITDECLSRRGVNCRICEDICETRAIRFRLKPGGISQPEINMSSCTSCGFCISVCPSRAIRITNKPDQYEEESCLSSISAAY